ncbi:MAG: four helix bundle protein [Alphaproteobacteria bacterium]|nr:four helix bundle protein [Alphaproteobacteria bacterium]
MKIQSYRDLDVWQKSRKLVGRIYKLTHTFPKEELYGLTNQLRRAAVSIPSNIAEGKSRRATRDYMRFLDIAYGSIAEVETQLFIACDLNYTTEKKITKLLEDYAEVGRMLNGLLSSLERKLNSPESRILNPESSHAS